MTRQQWQQFCFITRPATHNAARYELSHEARCCLHRYRLMHGETWNQLGKLFKWSSSTSKDSYNDIKWFILITNPFVTNPTQLNHSMTDQQVTASLC
jgi:hypothetical protein